VRSRLEETRALRRLMVTGLLVAGAAIFLTVLAAETPSPRFGWDFRYQYYTGGEAVLHGGPLYMDPNDPALPKALEDVMTYVYPPLVAVLSVPFTVLPVGAAQVVLFVMSVAALCGALALVGVRDIRCYAALFIWSPTWTALAVLNISSFLALAVAVAWRYRDRWLPLAAAIGLAIAAKVFLWPLLVWTLASRRYAATACALGIAFASTVAAWATIGFQGLREYPALAAKLADQHAENSYSIVGMTSALGIQLPVAHALMFLVGGLLLLACARFCRTDDDERGFACAIFASLVLTPIVWQHYILMLAPSLGLARPRFSWVWLVPTLLWLSEHEGNGDGIQPFLLTVVAVVFAYVLLVRPRPGVAMAPAETLP
jgi:hypothetical protein